MGAVLAGANAYLPESSDRTSKIESVGGEAAVATIRSVSSELRQMAKGKSAAGKGTACSCFEAHVESFPGSQRCRSALSQPQRKELLSAMKRAPKMLEIARSDASDRR